MSRSRARADTTTLALQAGYALALVFATFLTVLSAYLLSTSEFAVVTKSLIFATIAPLLFSWGVPDTVTFGSLRGNDNNSFYHAGFGATTLLALVATSFVCIYAISQGLDLTQSLLTGLVSGTSMLGMTCQGVELAENRFRQAASLAASPSLVALGVVLLFWGNGTLTATLVILARALGNMATLCLRVFLLRLLLFRRGGLLEMVAVLRLGTPVHISSVLAAGSLRLEQVLIVQLFSERSLAAYGLVMPAINGVRTLLYAAGTVEAVRLAREKNHDLRECHRRLGRLFLIALGLAPLAILGVQVLVAWTGNGQGLPLLASTLFVLGGTLGGLVDTLVRMYRGSGEVKRGVWARVASLTVTMVIGYWFINAGVVSAALVGILSSVCAYLVMLSAVFRKEVTE